MSVAMRFHGSLCFRSAGACERAVGMLADASSCLVRPEAVVRSHLMLAVDVDAVAGPLLWRSTLSTLTDVACFASSGSLSCWVDGEGAEHVVVVASGRDPAQSRMPLRTCASSWRTGEAMVGRSIVPGEAFAFDACQILTCYALRFEDDEPSEASRSFVFGPVPRRGIAPLASDIAPYLTVSAVDVWEDALNRAIGNARDDVALCEALQEMLVWSQDTGATWFGHQLEPAALAGEGCARRLGREAARRDPPAQPSDAHEDEFPLACDGPWPVGGDAKYVCPLCGSTDTVVVAVEDRRTGVTEVRCRGCGHFDAWTA